MAGFSSKVQRNISRKKDLILVSKIMATKFFECLIQTASTNLSVIKYECATTYYAAKNDIKLHWASKLFNQN